MDKKLYTPSKTKEIINKYGFRFSKSLGQNFLIDGNIIDNICDGSNITKDDYVLEIGPGIGTLTQELCERAERVIAIELDKRLIPVLNETLENYDNFEVINGDVLKIDLKELFQDKFNNKKVKVVANLPYYITTPIIMRLLEERLDIDKIVVMVQKEVAYRMKSGPGTKDYGSLSIAVGYYCDANIIVDVPKNVFIPKPNVDSAVISLDVYNKPKVNVEDEKLFFNIVRAAFSKRRKTLLNSLSKSTLGLEKDDIRNALESCDIDPKRRAETLTIEEYAKLANYIESIM